MNPNAFDIKPITEFLGCPTPRAWVDHALSHLDVLLVDHAHCEKKAASTALNLMFRYVEKPELLIAMSRLAREELRHFEQVLKIMRRREVRYDHLTPARYAQGLRKAVRTFEPDRLVDLLVVGAFIEARSCERFHALVPHLDDELAGFYRSLLASEGRHYQLYLELARGYSDSPLNSRIQEFRGLEAALITDPDPEFRFHSGTPAKAPITSTN